MTAQSIFGEYSSTNISLPVDIPTVERFDAQLRRLSTILSQFRQAPGRACNDYPATTSELEFILQQLSTQVQSFQSELKRQNSLDLFRAELWKAAASEYHSNSCFTSSLLEIASTYLKYDCVYFYSVVNSTTVQPMGAYESANKENKDDVEVLNRLLPLLFKNEAVSVVNYTSVTSNSDLIACLLKRFNTRSISIVLIRGELMNALFVFPDFQTDRFWQNWEIDWLNVLVDVFACRLHAIPILPFQVLNDNSVTKTGKNDSSAIRHLQALALLASGIANDYNELLSQITANLFLAKMGVQQTEDIYKRITEAEKAVFQATCLTNKLQFFSEDAFFLKENVTVRTILEDIVGFIVKDSTFDYKLDLPHDLWNVQVDKGRMEQVMKILIDNAAQSMNGGGLIQIRAENCVLNSGSENRSTEAVPLKNGNYVKISFNDQGCGISEEHQDKIFIPYFTTKLSKGGLGLAIAHAVVQQHGGYISFDSVQGKGSTFFIYLPAAETQDSESEKHFSLLQNEERDVLIIGDEPLLQVVLKRWLSRFSFRVISVVSLQKAEEMINENTGFDHHFSLVIFEGTADKVNYTQIVSQLKYLCKDAKLIAFCSHVDFEQYKGAGFDGVIGKTFSLNELAQLIGKVLLEGACIEA